MLITKKPANDQKLSFPKMGAKHVKKVAPVDVENAADAKKPGDKKEDSKKKSKNLAWAKKAATAIAKK